MSTPGRDWDNPEEMLGVDDALSLILAEFSPLSGVSMPLLDATGLVLAEDVVAGTSVPPFRNSAMDGYAVRSADTAHAPVALKVIATVPAGSRTVPSLGPGEAVRIMTGAPVPPGADSVVRFEETDEVQRAAGDCSVTVSRPARVHENIRDAGEDVAAGSVALNAGARLRPAETGVLASVGAQSVSVHRRPVVGILSTGDELVDLGDDQPSGTIRDSNSYMLAAAVKRVGGEPVMMGIASDSAAALKTRLQLVANADFIITSGGVSVGDYDLVKDVLQAEGQMNIWQVRMKPGKPLAFGRIGGVPLLGLPGNPVAALVSFEQFARPAILTMLGRKDVRIPTVHAQLAERVENRGQRRHFVRGTLTRESGPLLFQPAGVHGSAMLRSVAQSHCYMVVPEDRDVVEPGEEVTVQLPDEGL